MKISTRLRLTVYVPLTIAAVIALTLFFSSQETAKIQKNGDIVRQIRSSLTELNHCFFTYTLTHEEAMRQQFLAEHEKLTGMIAGARLYDPTQRRLLDSIRGDSIAMKNLFLQMVYAHQDGDTREVEDQLAGVLLSRSYQADTDASLLRTMVDDGIRVNETRTIYVIFLVMLLVSIPLTIVLVRTRHTITSSISALNKGSAVVGSGNLDFRIEEKGRDEITDLSRAFNQMTVNLKTVTASKSELEKEIEERKKAEEALRESEQRWATTLTSIGDGVIATDAAARVTFMNAVAEALTGWTLSEAFGKPVAEVFNIVNEKTRQAAENPVARVLKEGIIVGLANHTILIRKDKTEVPVDDSGAPIRGLHDKIIGVVLVFRDVTERNKVEQVKDDFIGMVSHELRTPLTVVTGAIHTAMLAGLPAKELPLLLQEAATGAASLSHILDNLLELSRHQAKRLLLNAEPLHIKEVTDNVLRQLRGKSPGHRLTADVPEQISIEADRVRVERILHNLVENAIKYSPQGGEIRIFVRRDDSSLTIGVSDQGIGISPEEQTRLFQPFQRGKSTKGIKGLGLGLVVCLRLVEAHQGRMWVESEQEKGSTFYFTLPLKQAGKSLPVPRMDY